MGRVRVPAPSTLRKYGLTLQLWRGILTEQGGGCGVCGGVPPSGTLHIEHEHVRGFKEMHPDIKRRFVRGLCCWMCNSVFLRRGATPEKLHAAAEYLARYAQRKGIN